MKIELKNISKKYNDKVILDNYSFSFEAGTIYLLCGNSGVGKTTLLRIIAGLEEADEGEVIGRTENISFDFQEDRLLERFDAITNIRLVTKRKYSDEELKALLTEIGIEGEDKKTIDKFSGGMKRRVALMRALLFESDILLLDEPFDGLDVEHKNKAMELTVKYSKNRLVILVTHNEDEIEYFMKLKNAEKIVLK